MNSPELEEALAAERTVREAAEKEVVRLTRATCPHLECGKAPTHYGVSCMSNAIDAAVAARVEAERRLATEKMAYTEARKTSQSLADQLHFATLARQRMREALEEAIGWFVFYTTPGGRPRNPHGMLAVLRAALGAEPGDAAPKPNCGCIKTSNGVIDEYVPECPFHGDLAIHSPDAALTQKEGQGAPAAGCACASVVHNGLRCTGDGRPMTDCVGCGDHLCRLCYSFHDCAKGAARSAPSPSNSSPIAADKGEGRDP